MTPFDPRLPLIAAQAKTFGECPKCGARDRCDKHGLTASGIDLRARGRDYSSDYDGERTV